MKAAKLHTERLSERSIILDDISLIELWGSNNANLRAIQNHFPKLKIITRGNSIKAIGDEQELTGFADRLGMMIAYLKRFGRLTERNVEEMLGGTATEENGLPPSWHGDDKIVTGHNGKIVRARTENQKKLVSAVNDHDVVFAIGPAGTGKTYTAVALAVRALKNREIKKIILARPAVEAGENLGFLPGDLKEKIDPYLRPLYDALDDMIPPERLKAMIETRIIEIAPMAFMRGRTLDNCFVILDEAQNATEMQLKMFLTRMGPHAKVIVTGDLTQIDLPKSQQSGLVNSLNILESIEGIAVVKLTVQDVVRHRLVKEIIRAYDQKMSETIR